MILLYARADHPSGYGMGDKAHGYSVLAITTQNWIETNAVKERMNKPFFNTSGDRTEADDEWYGGDFDLIAVIEGGSRILDYDGHEWMKRSYGDNRFFGVFRAAEILGGEEKS